VTEKARNCHCCNNTPRSGWKSPRLPQVQWVWSSADRFRFIVRDRPSLLSSSSYARHLEAQAYSSSSSVHVGPSSSTVLATATSSSSASNWVGLSWFTPGLGCPEFVLGWAVQVRRPKLGCPDDDLSSSGSAVLATRIRYPLLCSWSAVLASEDPLS
jgi:hypothetical protein